MICLSAKEPIGYGAKLQQAPTLFRTGLARKASALSWQNVYGVKAMLTAFADIQTSTSAQLYRGYWNKPQQPQQPLAWLNEINRHFCKLHASKPPEFAICTAYNYRMQLQNATAECSYSTQVQHAGTACDYRLQLWDAVPECRYSMQVPTAATGCSCSMQSPNAGQGAGVCGADDTPDMLHQSP